MYAFILRSFYCLCVCLSVKCVPAVTKLGYEPSTHLRPKLEDGTFGEVVLPKLGRTFAVCPCSEHIGLWA